MLGYLIGLPYGPKGVALGYSTAMILWAIPHTAWCVYGTGISLRDILMTVGRPLLSGLVGAAVAFSVHHACIALMSPLPRLVIAGLVLLAVYGLVLFYVVGQKEVFINVLQGLRKRPLVDEKALVSA
jgi:PST family polysaccharide transporter